MTPITARSCEAAKIQSDLADDLRAVRARRATQSTATAASPMHGPPRQVVRDRTRNDSTAAIQSASRVRRSLKPAARPCSSPSTACGESLSTCQPYHAGAVSQVRPSAAQRALRSLGLAARGGRGRRRVGPAPLTSARKAPGARSARRRAASTRGRSAAARRGRAAARPRRARRAASAARSSQPAAPLRASNAA